MAGGDLTVTEAELTDAVLELARELGLLVHHCKDSRTCIGHKGFADVVLAGPKGVIFRELKSEYGETSAYQDRWGHRLCQSRIEGIAIALWDIWRPQDLESGRVRRELALIGETR